MCWMLPPTRISASIALHEPHSLNLVAVNVLDASAYTNLRVHSRDGYQITGEQAAISQFDRIECRASESSAHGPARDIFGANLQGVVTCGESLFKKCESVFADAHVDDPRSS